MTNPLKSLELFDQHRLGESKMHAFHTEIATWVGMDLGLR